MGLGSLFGGANDIVVPTEGSWKTGDEPAAWFPAGRIACCGPGGNLTMPQAVLPSRSPLARHLDTLEVKY